MRRKIVLILDKSDSYVAFQKEQTLTEWSVESSDTKVVGSLKDVAESTLFGDSPTSVVKLDDAAAVKQALADIEGWEKKGVLDEKLESGVFISSPVARNSTKKLEAKILEIGGSVHSPKDSGSAKTTIAENLVSELSLNRETRDFLIAYAGNDYEILLPLMRTLSVLSEKQQKGITVEDMFVRLPQKPGSINPWEIEKHLFAGNLGKTIDALRRVHSSAHYLVALKMLNNKVQAAYRVSSVLTQNPRTSDKDLCDATGANAKSLWVFKNLHKQQGHDRLEKIVKVLADTEGKVKGGSAADGLMLMELALTKVHMIIRGEAL